MAPDCHRTCDIDVEHSHEVPFRDAPEIWVSRAPGLLFVGYEDTLSAE